MILRDTILCVYRVKVGAARTQNRAPLASFTPSKPFELVFADITELPVTSKGNRYLLVLMDHFTKYVNIYPMSDQRAATVAKCTFENYV